MSGDVRSDASARLALREALLDWFRAQQRELPWRETEDPYAIWISEIMLQQTRVEAVKPYYARFLEAFPTVEALAQAELSQVLALWSGLGYYRRARNLHAAAQKVVEEFGGTMPASRKEILSLPGIGRYTAGAILSIAYGQEEALVDGNVQRVFARLFCLSDPVGSSALARDCWEYAEALVRGEAPGDFNQSLMELGAMVCTPRRPTCMLCPVHAHCGSFAQGTQDAFPVPKAAKEVRERDVLWALVRRAGKILLVRRPDEGLFAGLWEFPGLYLEEGQDADAAVLLTYLNELGLSTALHERPNLHEHLLTHRRLKIQLYHCKAVRGRVNLPRERWRWVKLDALPQLGLSSITRKLLDSLSP